MKSKRERVIKLVLFAVFILLLLIAAVFFVVGVIQGHFKSEEALESYIRSCGPFAPLLLVGIQIMQAILPIIPSFFGFVAGAALFGIWGGFLCNYIGISLGAIIAYFLARFLGSGFVEQIIPKEKFEKVVNKAQSGKSFTLVLFFSILLPIAPDCALCYFSGLIRMPIKKFLLIILAAKPWCILVYSILFGKIF